MFHHETRILRIEHLNISLGKPGVWMGPYRDIHTIAFLGENIKCADIHIAIYENNLATSLLYKRYKQFKRVEDLPIKEDFLLRETSLIHVIEDPLETLIGSSLVFQLPQLNGTNLLEHCRIGGNKVAHFYEGLHYSHAHVNGDIAVQHSRKHGNALFGERLGHVATAATLLG